MIVWKHHLWCTTLYKVQITSAYNTPLNHREYTTFPIIHWCWKQSSLAFMMPSKRIYLHFPKKLCTVPWITQKQKTGKREEVEDHNTLHYSKNSRPAHSVNVSQVLFTHIPPTVVYETVDKPKTPITAALPGQPVYSTLGTPKYGLVNKSQADGSQESKQGDMSAVTRSTKQLPNYTDLRHLLWT